MSVVLTANFLLDAIVRKVLMDPLPTVGLSFGIKPCSSNPRATKRALLLPSLDVITHLVDIAF